MTEPRIGIFILDGVTLNEVAATRACLESAGVQVMTIVPTGGSLLPIGGRYFPGAGGRGTRRPLHHVAPDTIDLLVLPDTITAEQLARYPQFLRLARGHGTETDATPVPVVTCTYLAWLLARGIDFGALATRRNPALSSGARGG